MGAVGLMSFSPWDSNLHMLRRDGTGPPAPAPAVPAVPGAG